MIFVRAGGVTKRCVDRGMSSSKTRLPSALGSQKHQKGSNFLYIVHSMIHILGIAWYSCEPRKQLNSLPETALGTCQA